MESNQDVIHEALGRLAAQAGAWVGVRAAVQEDGITQLLFARGVLARLHPDGLVEIPYPRPVGEKLVAAGRADRHHALPDSGWVNTRLAVPADVDRVLELLRLSYEARRTVPGRVEGESQSDTHSEKLVDHSVDASFPASDPPASSRD